MNSYLHRISIFNILFLATIQVLSHCGDNDQTKRKVTGKKNPIAFEQLGPGGGGAITDAVFHPQDNDTIFSGCANIFFLLTNWRKLLFTGAGR